MPKQSKKCNRVNLSVMQNLEVIKKLKKGANVASVCKQYGVKKQTVSGIRKSKAKLTKYTASYCVDASSSDEQT